MGTTSLPNHRRGEREKRGEERREERFSDSQDEGETIRRRFGGKGRLVFEASQLISPRSLSRFSADGPERERSPLVERWFIPGGAALNTKPRENRGRRGKRKLRRRRKKKKQTSKRRREEQGPTLLDEEHRPNLVEEP